MKKILLTLCVSAAMLMPAALAQADVIYDWSYSTTVVLKDMQWSDSYATDRPGQAVGAEINGGYAEYRWGQYINGEIDKNSGLTVQGFSDTITAGGESASGLLITHFNNPIVEGLPTPTSGTIYTTVELSAGSGIAYTVNSSLSFSFFETPNENEAGDGPSLYPNDIFFMTESEIMKSVGSFVHDGERYSVYLSSNLQALEGEYLRMAQEYGGYSSDTALYGWTTVEGETLSNAYELSLTIMHAPVPLPGAIWLMGSGIAGLVALRRRNTA